MKFWYLVLKLSPAFLLLAGLSTAVVDALTLANMPEPMREFMPAGGAFVMLPALVKTLLAFVGAAAMFWLGKIVDTIIPAARG